MLSPFRGDPDRMLLQCRSVAKLFFFCHFVISTIVTAFPTARSSAMALHAPEGSQSVTDLIQTRAVHLNNMAIRGGWNARFSSMTCGLSVGIAVNHLEQLYSNVIELTEPESTHGPLHKFFGAALGDLELVFEAVDPSQGVPWDLVYAFAWQAKNTVALGLAGLYTGRLQNSAGQVVKFSLQLRTWHPPDLHGSLVG